MATSHFEDLIVVGGAPRSGTTLVQNILDSHPEVYGGPEFGILPSLVQLRRELHRNVGSGVIRTYVTEEAADEALRALAITCLRPPALRRGACRISEKTPGNAVCLAEILELFPQATGIQVVRDPRAVLASMKRVRERYQQLGKVVPDRLQDPTAMASTIHRHFLAGVSAVVAHPGRAVVLRYEDLVQDPEATIRRLCLAVGLEFRATMLNPAARPHDAEGLVHAGTPWYTVEEFQRDPDPSRMEAWRTEIDAVDLEALRQAFGEDADQLAQWGYALS